MTSIEEKWVTAWNTKGVFQPPATSDKQKFFLTVPYPYPTGPLHVGHGRTYTNADVMARFERLKGKEVFWPMGFHVTGTPILAICDAIKRGDEKMIQLYTEYVSIYEKNPAEVTKIVSSFTEPINVANYFSKHISEDMNRTGFSIDWRSTFTTMDDAYQKFIAWQFEQLFEKGALVKGKYPILFSAVDKNAVGEDDIKDGDTDKVTVNEFDLILFPMPEANTFLVAATVRPETLFGATNVWINPDIEYVCVDVGEEKWIVSTKTVEKFHQQGKKMGKSIPVDVHKLLEKKVAHPLVENTPLPILPASFVSAERGTGIVYSVPAHAPWDYMALSELKKNNHVHATRVEPVSIITTPSFEGMESFLQKKQVTKLAQKEKIQAATEELYKLEFYDGIMNDKNDFLAGMPVKKAKEKLVEILSKNGKHGILYEPSRPALTRAGNPVSVAVLEDQWFLDYSSKEWKEKTARLAEGMTIYPERFKKTVLDAIDWVDKRPCIRKRGLGTSFPFDKEWMIEPLSDSTIYMVFYLAIKHIRAQRVPIEELDSPFFNAALLGKKLPETDSRCSAAKAIYADIQYWYPVDWRHTAPAHISNHIAFFLFTHTLLFDETKWPKGMSFNEMLNRNGVKMSKSKGNVIPLLHAVNDFGADLVRLFIISSASFERMADWKDNQVPQVQKKLSELENVIRESIDSVSSEKQSDDSPAIWLQERIREKLGEAYMSFEQMDYMIGSQKVFFETLNEIRRYRKVFGTSEGPALRPILKEWLGLVSIVTPFLAEELWEKYSQKENHSGGEKNPPLLASQLVIEKPVGIPSAEITERVELIEKVLQDTDKVKKFVKGKKPAVVFIYSADPTETNWLKNAQEQIAKYSLLEVRINDAHDPLNKMEKAQKGRPALYLE